MAALGLTNRRGAEEDTCVGGFPDLSKVSVAQRKEVRREYKVSLSISFIALKA